MVAIKLGRNRGAHLLGLTGLVGKDNVDHLASAARMASNTGCNLVELACSPIVSGVTGTDIAQALTAGAVKQASWCRFFPKDQEGNFPFGDPLGEKPDDRKKAFDTFDADFAIIEEMRTNGIEVTDVTGPWAYGLGHLYGFSLEEARDRLFNFGSEMGARFKHHSLIGSLEYLRWGEDKVISGIDALCTILDRINLPEVKAHLDTFHMEECQENAWEVILKAGARIGMFHANGSKRRHPGAFQYAGDKTANDLTNWYLVACALQIVRYRGTVTSEPFCKAIRDAIAALGEGLPEAIEAQLYFHLANQHLDKMGMFTFAA